ncbi:MAG: long-chain-acyl-CoA synthetase [archaeon]|nr:long-chain-acyl-CoA synthetase [archaeon]
MSNIIDRKTFKKDFNAFMLKNDDNFKKIKKINSENTTSFGSVIESNAIEFGDRPAIYFEDVVLTYKEFNEIVNQYANYFLSLGLKKGEIIDLMMKNRLEYLIILGAIGKIGAIGSLINADQREKSLIYSISSTLGKIIIIGEECLEQFEQVRKSLELTDQILILSPDSGKAPCPADYFYLSEAIKKYPKNNPETTKNVRTFDNFVYIFTSGTTGLPKAANFPHQRFIVAGFFNWMIGALNHDDTMYISTPLFHSNSLSVGVGGAFAQGGTIALARKFSASHFWDDCRKYKATCFNYVGELCRYLLNQPPKSDDANNPVKSIIGNGIRPEIWMEFKNRFDIPRIGEFYGASEAGGQFGNILNYDNTCGYSMMAFSIVKYNIEEDKAILNEKGRMIRTKPGDLGLLLFPFYDDGFFTGYKDKKETEAKLFRNVFRKGDAFINTGDLVRDQGCRHVQFVDRLGDTFRWKGHNVSTTEVEKIFNLHGTITLASVYGVKIPGTDGRAGMCAFEAAVPEENFDFKGLTEQLNKNLPPYAVPIFLRFKIESINTTSTFKLKKTQLKKEGFALENIDDPLYVMLPGTKEYTSLTKEIHEGILNSKYQF